MSIRKWHKYWPELCAVALSAWVTVAAPLAWGADPPVNDRAAPPAGDGLGAASSGDPFARAPSDDPFAIVREESFVTGAAKHPQPLGEAPSSVTVITAEEIRTHGYATVAEALRWVRGLFVTYDRSYSYVGVRGLLRPGDYNNKVLLAIDGHTLNGYVYGDGLFGNELGLDLENVERIEVVRGPGSALYGSYAVLAVVNVVTRHPSREPGIALAGRAGAWGDRRLFAAWSSSTPGGPQWRLSGSWQGARGPDLYFAEYDHPLSHSGRAIDADGEEAGGLFGTIEWGSSRLAAKLNSRMKRFPTGAFETTFGDRRNRTYDGHDFVELSDTRRLAGPVELQSRAYWDGARYRGFYIEGPDTATKVNFDRGDGDLVGTELRVHWSPGTRDVVTLGTEGQYDLRARMDNFDEVPFVVYVRQNPRSGRVAAYLQDERRVGSSVLVTAGGRADRYADFDPVVSPRLDVVWEADPGTRVKLLAGSAFRAPSVYETRYDLYRSKVGLLPERVNTLEGAVVRTAGPLTADFSIYGNWVRDLIDLVRTDTLGTLEFRNRARVVGRGVEAELAAVGSRGTRARLSAAWQTSRDRDTGLELTNSPRWNAQAVLTHAPLSRPYGLGIGVRYLSPRWTLAHSRTAPAVVVDARVSALLPRAFQVGLDARNLFDSRHGDPGSAEHREDEIIQDHRALFLTVELRSRRGP